MEKVFDMGRDKTITKVLLYSGGMDSWLCRQLWKPDKCLYINVGSVYSAEEIERLDNGVDYAELPLGKYERKDNYVVPLRNLYFAMLATNEYQEGDLEICLGATVGDRPQVFKDKSDEWAAKTSDLLTYLYSRQSWNPVPRKINVVLPYVKWSKAQMLWQYIKNGGDIETAMQQTFSCHSPHNDHECWNCKPCFRKFVAFYQNGYIFDDDIKRQMLKYAEQNVMCDWASWSYERGCEADEVLHTVKELRDEFGV